MKKVKYYPGSYKNSFNALAGHYNKDYPLNGIMRMLAQIGYVLSDILAVLNDEHYVSGGDDDADV